MSNKIIITTLIIFLAVSFTYLSFSEQKQHASDNWWVLYFTEPKNDNLDFVIENHEGEKKFHWEVLVGTDKIKEGDIKVAKGAIWKSDFQVIENSKKITVRVLSSDEKKGIYKYLQEE